MKKKVTKGPSPKNRKVLKKEPESGSKRRKVEDEGKTLIGE